MHFILLTINLLVWREKKYVLKLYNNYRKKEERFNWQIKIYDSRGTKKT